MAFRVYYSICQSLATISSSEALTGAMKKLYCSCNNMECGHTFVVDVSFSHTLNPSLLDFPVEVREKIKTMTRYEIRDMFSKCNDLVEKIPEHPYKTKASR